MLDTLLEIGRVLRESPDGLKHHRYMIKGPFGEPKKQIEFWTVPVEADGSFNLQDVTKLTDENVLKQLYLLNFKTSDADSTKKYVFGDLYWFFNGDNESGNFILGEPARGQKNSFFRGEEDAYDIDSALISEFRNSFKLRISLIERYLRRKQRNAKRINENKSKREAKQNAGVYLHFDFGGKHWYELPEMDKLNDIFLQNFYEETPQGYVLTPYVYKTLIGDKKTPNSIPDFNTQGRKNFRTRVFQADERLALLYAIDYSKCAVITQKVLKVDSKIVVLPRGDGMTAQQIERFFERQGLTDAETGEEQFRYEAEVTSAQTDEETNGADELFAHLPLHDETFRDFAQFDLIFCNTAGKTEVDLTEISSLERSHLSEISQRIREIRLKVENQRDQSFTTLPKDGFGRINVIGSFLNILGDTTKAKKKYQRHLLTVLPQIYTESYFHDPVLLPALIEKTEYNIRNDKWPDFRLLRFDFYFLTLIQNQGEQNLMNIQESPSYHIGQLLGTMARPLKSKINSFDKNYAGLISRRVTTLADVMSLQNEINQKLIMHDRAGTAGMFSPQLTEAVKGFAGRYDKNEVTFGFFESYFAPSNKADKEDEDKS